VLAALWALDVVDTRRTEGSADATTIAGAAPPPVALAGSVPTERKTGSSASPIEVAFSQEGGYRLRYPAAWTVERSGEVTKVASPDGSEIVSFALGPVGLPPSFDSFSSLIAGAYEQVEIIEHEAASVQGNTAIQVDGRATNSANVSLRFRALIVERPGRSSVGGFAAAHSGRALSSDAIAVLESLRVEG
jgi:hypothetical protein